MRDEEWPKRAAFIFGKTRLNLTVENDRIPPRALANILYRLARATACDAAYIEAKCLLILFLVGVVIGALTRQISVLATGIFFLVGMLIFTVERACHTRAIEIGERARDEFASYGARISLAPGTEEEGSVRSDDE